METIMALFIWKEQYSINIKLIDDQHQVLVGLVNKLYDSMIIGKGKDVLGYILDELMMYTKYHFTTEEQYFQEYNYPEMHLHKLQHQELIAKTEELQAKYKLGETVLTLEVMNFLKDWIFEHINCSDKRFGSFVNSNGIK